ncbi:hypothetical protein AB0H03_04220 [Streptomyces sparsogenes]|uniref:hypothetical protein n=1 Tax=Streptomyces sparsogenes TaxID=67365 RepID=UPI0033F30508
MKPIGSDELDHMSKRCRAANLLAAASCLTLLVAGCSDDDKFAHQYPDVDVNVSLEQALRDHGVKLPKNAQDVKYSANDGPEGYPLYLTFKASCSAMRSFSEKNKFTRLPMEKVWGTGAAVAAQGRGWTHRAGDYGFSRNPGVVTSKRVSVLVSPKGSVCHVWLDSWS